MYVCVSEYITITIYIKSFRDPILQQVKIHVPYGLHDSETHPWQSNLKYVDFGSYTSSCSHSKQCVFLLNTVNFFFASLIKLPLLLPAMPVSVLPLPNFYSAVKAQFLFFPPEISPTDIELPQWLVYICITATNDYVSITTFSHQNASSLRARTLG